MQVTVMPITTWELKKKALNKKIENVKEAIGIQVTCMFKINLQKYVC